MHFVASQCKAPGALRVVLGIQLHVLLGQVAGPEAGRRLAQRELQPDVDLALLTKYDLGNSAKKWREWHRKRTLGLVAQAKEDREDKARVLRMQMRTGKKKRDEEAQQY